MPPSMAFIAYNTVRGPSSQLSYISKRILKIKADCIFPSEEKAFISQNLGNGVGHHTDRCPRTKPAGQGTDLGSEHQPGQVSALQSRSAGWTGQGTVEPLPTAHAKQPSAGLPESHPQIQPSPEFIRWWASLPPDSHLPLATPGGTCSSPGPPHFPCHSALEVNIIKYILILKDSLRIFTSVYQKCLCQV